MLFLRRKENFLKLLMRQKVLKNLCKVGFPWLWIVLPNVCIYKYNKAFFKKKVEPISDCRCDFISLETVEKLNQKEQQFAQMLLEVDQLRSNLTGKGATMSSLKDQFCVS